MRHLWLALPLLFAVAAPVALHAPVAIAAKAATPSLDGRYQFVAAESDDVDRAIDAAVSSMNFVMKPIAHGRLAKTNVPYQKVTIAAGDEVSIKTDARAPIVTSPNGKPEKWKREDGLLYDVSTKLAGNAITQTFEAEDGKRVNHWSLSPDGKTLTCHVTVTSPKLPKALTYKLVYRRV